MWPLFVLAIILTIASSIGGVVLLIINIRERALYRELGEMLERHRSLKEQIRQSESQDP